MSEELLFEGEEHPHLLLVDDDPHLYRVLARGHEPSGLRVSTAGSAEEGLALAQQDTPDYAVLDLKMEGDSGLVLLPKLLELHADMRRCPHRLFQHRHRGGGDQARRLQLPVPADADDVLAALPLARRPGHPGAGKNPMSVDRLQWEYIQRARRARATSATARVPWACIDGPLTFAAQAEAGRCEAEA